MAAGRWFRVIDVLLDDPASHWWDDSETDEIEARDDILVRALEAAVDELGTNPDRWDWTEMHTATFENATLGQSGIPPLEWILNSGLARRGRGVGRSSTPPGGMRPPGTAT